MNIYVALEKKYFFQEMSMLWMLFVVNLNVP